MAPPRLGIIAGGGPLPRMVAEAALVGGREPFLLALEGETEAETVQGLDHRWVALGAVGRALRLLAAARVGEICLIGKVRRPSLRGLRPDLRATRLLARLAFDLSGEDRLLRALIAELEREGLTVVGPLAIRPDLALAAGSWTRHRPDAAAGADIAHGQQAMADLAARDLGQAVIVHDRRLLATEGEAGTGAMLREVAARGTARGAVLVKLPKPGQDRRVDLPVIGPETVAAAAQAGLTGIAVEAGGTILVDRPAVLAAAEAAGLFLEALPPP